MNQPSQKQTGKRTVSKGIPAFKDLQTLSSPLLVLLLIVTWKTLFLLFQWRLYLLFWGMLVLLLLGGLLGCLWGALMAKTMSHVANGIHRYKGYANTADLSVPNTLVRASEEPVQGQQAVLLRAATDMHETPLEQLVTASAGGVE